MLLTRTSEYPSHESFRLADPLGIQRNLGFTTLQRGIASAQVSHHPFPYLTVNSMFSDEEYRRLLHDLPDDDCYEWESGMRGSLPLRRRALWRIGRKQRLVWMRLSKLMTSEGFVRLVVSKFQNVLGAKVQRQLVEPRVRLIRDKPGFQLRVHTDHTWVALVLLVYLRIDSPERGTQLFRPRKGFEAHDGSHRSAEEFKKVGHTSLASGSGLCFPNTENSFHGMNGGKSIESSRDVLMYTLSWGDPSSRRGLRARWRRALEGNFGWPLNLDESTE